MAHALPSSILPQWAGTVTPPQYLLRDWREMQADLGTPATRTGAHDRGVRLALLGPHCESHLADTRKSSKCFLRPVTGLSWAWMVFLQPGTASHGWEAGLSIRLKAG